MLLMKTRRAMSDKLQFVIDPEMGALQEPRQTEVCRTFSEEVKYAYKRYSTRTMDQIL